MKTGLMYRNHYGKAHPEPKHQSSFRDNKENYYDNQTHYVATVGQQVPSIPAYPLHVMAKEVLIIFVALAVVGMGLYLFCPVWF